MKIVGPGLKEDSGGGVGVGLGLGLGGGLGGGVGVGVCGGGLEPFFSISQFPSNSFFQQSLLPLYSSGDPVARLRLFLASYLH